MQSALDHINEFCAIEIKLLKLLVVFIQPKSLEPWKRVRQVVGRFQRKISGKIRKLLNFYDMNHKSVMKIKWDRVSKFSGYLFSFPEISQNAAPSTNADCLEFKGR